MTTTDARTDTIGIGFACNWDPVPEGTWSGTPWQLRTALAAQARVVDLDVSPSRAERLALRAVCARPGPGGLRSPWKHSRWWLGRVERSLRHRGAVGDCDVVLEIGDLGVTDRPYVVMLDLSFDVLLERLDPDTGRVHHFPGLGRSRLERLAERQRHVLHRAAGVLAMSDWLADHLTTRTGVAADRVHVVPPGIVSGPAPPPAPVRRPPTRLLFLGRDFATKGGDVAVRAMPAIRAERPAVTLTVAGPRRWPMATPPPAGVRFVGPVAPTAVTALLDAHDVLVMPSRLEGFGKVLVEALARGRPCVARADCAMGELVTPGENGALVQGEDPAELAACVLAVLDDDDLFGRCHADHAAVADRFSWERAARRAVTAMHDALR